MAMMNFFNNRWGSTRTTSNGFFSAEFPVEESLEQEIPEQAPEPVLEVIVQEEPILALGRTEGTTPEIIQETTRPDRPWQVTVPIPGPREEARDTRVAGGVVYGYGIQTYGYGDDSIMGGGRIDHTIYQTGRDVYLGGGGIGIGPGGAGTISGYSSSGTFDTIMGLQTSIHQVTELYKQLQEKFIEQEETILELEERCNSLEATVEALLNNKDA
jgi:Ca2+-binding RTX toxin-like protein